MATHTDQLKDTEQLNEAGEADSSAQPETAQPDTAQPDTAQPDTAQPDTAQPDTAQPDSSAQPDNTAHPEDTDDPAGAGVQIKALTRRFGDHVVLDGVDLDIAPGEFVALLGRSGSGKSTLLRALAGLDHDVVGTGDLTIPDRVSVVFQDSRLLPWRRVLDNVILGNLIQGRRAADARDRGLAALAEVGLAGRERAWPNQLSGGEQQRVALARSLVGEPELLLADEPFGALDALTRIRMHDLLRALCKLHQPSVLLVTHDVDEALLLADRIVVLEGGRIAVDLRPGLPENRSHRDPGFQQARDLLLNALGVKE